MLKAELQKLSRKAGEKKLEKRAEERHKLSVRAQEIAKNIIRGLPKELRRAARVGRGDTDKTVLTSEAMIPGLFQEVACIVAEYCRKKGLKTRIEHYRPIGSDDLPAHDYLVVSWGEKGEKIFGNSGATIF